VSSSAKELRAVTKLLATATLALVTGFGGDAFAVPAVQHSAVADHVAVGHGNRHRSWVRGAEVHAFNFPVESPRDASSGLPTGKRMHKPYAATAHAGHH
jgi:hypothetical protein